MLAIIFKITVHHEHYTWNLFVWSKYRNELPRYLDSKALKCYVRFTGHILLFTLLLKPCSIIAGNTLDLAVTHFLHTRHTNSSILLTFFAENIVCPHRLTLELTHWISIPFWVKKNPWIIDLPYLACKLIFPNFR